MKKTVIKFGIFSSLLMVAGMAISIRFSDYFGFDNGVWIGYTTMIISFLMIFFGVRSYRDKMNGGTINFGKAFKIGGLIALISCIVYVLAWLIIYYNFMPDFADKYAAFTIEKMKNAHASQIEIDAAMQEMTRFKELYKNPFYNAAMTFLEPLPVALLMSLLSAAILKRKKVSVQPA